MRRTGTLQIDADLTVSVTAADGRSTTAHAVGEGGNLRVTTPRPDVLLAAVDRNHIGPLADMLDTVGMSIYVDGPGGQVAVIGSAASSRVGRLLTGSAHAAIRPSGAIRAAARPGVLAVLAVVVIVVLRALGRRR